MHNGHVMMASLVSELDFVDRLIFMPARKPTHKETGDGLADAQHRYNMCKIAAEGIKKAVVSDFEINSPHENYTYYTLKSLKRLYPDREYCLLIGADMLVSFDKWFRYEDIIKMCGLIVVKRVGIDYGWLDNAVTRFRKEGAEIYLPKGDVAGVSSTMVRSRIDDLEFLSRSVPPEILDYIENNNLYKGKC